MGIDHYENFPVASVLCPPSIRPAVIAIYRFARTADDIADEGNACPEERLTTLAAFRNELTALYGGPPALRRWPEVFGPLAEQIHRHVLPRQPLADLLDAFEQDIHNPPYPDRIALLDYCRRSANPVGRLLLHLYGVHDATSLARSDAICSALQLANFWQDLSIDAPRGRHYVPRTDQVAHGVGEADLAARRDGVAVRRLVASLCDWTESLFEQGAPLALALPGRIGWELRLVVQGGRRIVAKLRAMDHAALLQRPRLTAADAPLLLWHALRMAGR